MIELSVKDEVYKAFIGEIPNGKKVECKVGKVPSVDNLKLSDVSVSSGQL